MMIKDKAKNDSVKVSDQVGVTIEGWKRGHVPVIVKHEAISEAPGHGKSWQYGSNIFSR